MIAAAAVKTNKMADGEFPRWEGKQGAFLLIFSNDDCIINELTIPKQKLPIYHAGNVNR